MRVKGTQEVDNIVLYIIKLLVMEVHLGTARFIEQRFTKIQYEQFGDGPREYRGK